MAKKAEKEEVMQLTVKIAADLHKELRKRAIDNGISIKKWVEQAFVERIMRENRAQ